MSAPVSVVIVEDHPAYRAALVALLEPHPRVVVIGEAETVDDALELIRATTPDVVLLDLRLGEEDGLDVARQLRADGQPVAILVLTSQDRPTDLWRALTSGANGYALKNSSAVTLLDAVLEAAEGEAFITPELADRLTRESLDSLRAASAPMATPTTG